MDDYNTYQFLRRGRKRRKRRELLAQEQSGRAVLKQLSQGQKKPLSQGERRKIFAQSDATIIRTGTNPFKNTTLPEAELKKKRKQTSAYVKFEVDLEPEEELNADIVEEIVNGDDAMDESNDASGQEDDEENDEESDEESDEDEPGPLEDDRDDATILEELFGRLPANKAAELREDIYPFPPSEQIKLVRRELQRMKGGKEEKAKTPESKKETKTPESKKETKTLNEAWSELKRGLIALGRSEQQAAGEVSLVKEAIAKSNNSVSEKIQGILGYLAGEKSK